MCGRFTIKVKTEQLRDAVRGLNVTHWSGPRYNVAPGQAVPVVRDPAARRLEWLRWGLVPAWAADPAIGNRLINARAETLADKASFRDALKTGRCVILADGFYEWAAQEGRKQPYYFHRRDDAPFAFAGLWSAWRPPQGAELLTCTIITTRANETVAPVHDRMPVILDSSRVDEWLAPGALPPLEILGPCPADALRCHPVGRQVNRPGVDDASCIAPLEDRAGAVRGRQLQLEF